jgi:hypothetical protein
VATPDRRIDQRFRWTWPHRKPWASRQEGVSLLGVFVVVLVVVLAYWFVIAWR